MKHTAIEPTTGKLLTSSEATRSFSHKYVPRIRCSDCLVSSFCSTAGNLLTTVSRARFTYLVKA